MKRRFIFFISFSILVAIGLLLSRNAKQKLEKKHAVVCAEIVSSYISRGGPVAKFMYVYKGVTYTNKLGCLNMTIKNYEAGINRIYVVLDVKNPHLSFLLERPIDFEKFNISINDTIGKNCY
jgi:hypothetical protein